MAADQARPARVPPVHTASHGGRWGAVARYTVAILVALIFGVAGTLFGVMMYGSRAFREGFGRFWTNPTTAYTPEREFPGVTAMNVLILGVDRDMDNRRRVLKTNGRSDSILIARVNFVDRSIRALTIPRDTAVRIPGRRGISKINAAHAFGGPALTAETIQTVFGIPTDHYVTINFDGFCKVVDAIGGVDLTVEKRLKYDDNWGGLHINLYPGPQHLTGYQAMGYVRMRHSDSDEMRSKRQHRFLEAVRTKLKHPLTWPKVPGAVDQLADSLKRSPNLTVHQMLTLANFARGLEATRIEVQTLPSIEGRSYVTVKRTEAQELIRRMFFPDQLTEFSIGTPDDGVVAGLNGEYRRRSRSRTPAREQTVTATEDATETPAEEPPIGDGITTPTPAGESQEGEGQGQGESIGAPEGDPGQGETTGAT